MDLVADAQERMAKQANGKLVVSDIGELAHKWNMTPRQVCDTLADQGVIPVGVMDHLNYCGWSSQMILDATNPGKLRSLIAQLEAENFENQAGHLNDFMPFLELKLLVGLDAD